MLEAILGTGEIYETQLGVGENLSQTIFLFFNATQQAPAPLLALHTKIDPLMDLASWSR